MRFWRRRDDETEPTEAAEPESLESDWEPDASDFDEPAGGVAAPAPAEPEPTDPAPAEPEPTDPTPTAVGCRPRRRTPADTRRVHVETARPARRR